MNGCYFGRVARRNSATNIRYQVKTGTIKGGSVRGDVHLSVARFAQTRRSLRIKAAAAKQKKGGPFGAAILIREARSGQRRTIREKREPAGPSRRSCARQRRPAAPPPNEAS